MSLLHFVRGNSSWARVDPKDGMVHVLGHTVGKITKDERTNKSVGFVPEESPQEVVKVTPSRCCPLKSIRRSRAGTQLGPASSHFEK